MPWQERMRVEVVVALEVAPTQLHFAAAREDASSLTDDPRSVRVELVSEGDRHQLVARFTMPFEAQYRVVGRIADRFGRGVGCVRGSLDLTIRFPTDQPARRRKRSRPHG